MFVNTRELLESWGSELRSQSATDWTGLFELPDQVAEIYRKIGPDNTEVPAYGNSVFIPSLAGLWDLQTGYRSHGITGERLTDWPDRLLVVASQGGDPIATDRSTGDVVFALHGSGAWNFEELGDSLLQVFVGLGVLGATVDAAGLDLCGDDDFVRQVHVDRADAEMTDLVGEKMAHRMLRWAEWRT